MKKIFLAVFIMLDISIMAGAGLFLYAHLTQHELPFGIKSGLASSGITQVTPTATPAPLVQAPPMSNTLMGASTSTASGTSPTHSLLTSNTVATSAMAGLHHVGFKYRNSKAHKVDIKADFTQWKSEAMTNSSGTWTYMASLPPGDYEYCFIVDDSKGIRDPANKKTKQIGTTYVSAITVSALPAKAK